MTDAMETWDILRIKPHCSTCRYGEYVGDKKDVSGLHEPHDWCCKRWDKLITGNISPADCKQGGFYGWEP